MGTRVRLPMATPIIQCLCNGGSGESRILSSTSQGRVKRRDRRKREGIEGEERERTGERRTGVLWRVWVQSRGSKERVNEEMRGRVERRLQERSGEEVR